jgi:hypothetical protein
MSADGSVLAVGDDALDKVFVYRWNGSEWELSETITGDQSDESFGFSLALSADGTTLVVGSPFWDDNGFSPLPSSRSPGGDSWLPGPA